MKPHIIEASGRQVLGMVMLLCLTQVHDHPQNSSRRLFQEEKARNQIEAEFIVSRDQENRRPKSNAPSPSEVTAGM